MRRRFVLINGDLIEVSADYDVSRDAQNYIIGDRHYAGLRASDGTDISTRSRHRAYMKKNNYTTMDDFRDEWKRAAKDREARLAGHDPSRKQDVADVVYGRMPLSKPHGREGDPL